MVSPGLPILMSYCPEQVIDIGEESYLVGPHDFPSASTTLATPVSLQVADLYQLAGIFGTAQRDPDAGAARVLWPSGWTDHVDGRSIFCSGHMVWLFRRGPDAGWKGG